MKTSSLRSRITPALAMALVLASPLAPAADTAPAAPPAPAAGPGPGPGGMQGMGGGRMGKRCPMHGMKHAMGPRVPMPRLPPGNDKLQMQMEAEILQKIGEIQAKYAAQLP
jgi:hypothetical protein